MVNNLLSIVMVTYNHGNCLDDAIDSVMTQTYDQWELVVIDDGSQDDSLSKLSTYAQKYPSRIRLITHADNKNLGIAASYKKGFEYCRGEYIGFLEPDDIWEPHNAKIKIGKISEGKAIFTYSDVLPFGEKDIIALRRSALRLFATAPCHKPFDAFFMLMIANIVPSFSSVIARSDVFLNVQFLTDRSYEVWLDWYLWIQISLATPFVFLPEKLVRWRLYRNSYCNKFVLKKSFFAMVMFELKYRWMIFKTVRAIRNKKTSPFLRLVILTFISFLCRIRLFLFNTFTSCQK